MVAGKKGLEVKSKFDNARVREKEMLRNRTTSDEYGDIYSDMRKNYMAQKKDAAARMRDADNLMMAQNDVRVNLHAKNPLLDDEQIDELFEKSKDAVKERAAARRKAAKVETRKNNLAASAGKADEAPALQSDKQERAPIMRDEVILLADAKLLAGLVARKAVANVVHQMNQAAVVSKEDTPEYIDETLKEIFSGYKMD